MDHPVPLQFTPLKSRDEPIREIAAPLLCMDGSRALASGTAVIVAPYIALTAKHVVEDYAHQFGSPTKGTSEIRARIALHQITPDGDCVFEVRNVWSSDITDIAVLFFVPASEGAAQRRLRYPPLRLVPPPVGTNVVGFGFHSSAADMNGAEGVQWDVKTATTTGQIVEIHERGRDQRLNFPCFRTNARLDGGMSGGPFFSYRADGSMELCGIGCSNLPPSCDGEEHATYVCALWPAMGTLITAPREPPAVGSFPLIELVREIAADADRVLVRKVSEERVEVALTSERP